MDKDRKLGGITEEEDGSIIKHPIPVTLFCIKLDGKAAGVSGRIGAALLAADGGKSSDALGLLANITKHVQGCLDNYQQLLRKWWGFGAVTRSLMSSRSSNSPYAPAPLA